MKQNQLTINTKRTKLRNKAAMHNSHNVSPGYTQSNQVRVTHITHLTQVKTSPTRQTEHSPVALHKPGVHRTLNSNINNVLV